MVTPVRTRSFDNYRSNCYVDPTWRLTSSYVQKNGVRVVARLKLDDPRGTEGQILGEPLIGMRDGQKHNAIFCADMSNSAYCFDADDCQLLWKQILGRPITMSARYDMHQINPFWGTLATGVINPDAGVIYYVSASSIDGSMEKISHRLHTLSLVDGSYVAKPLVLDDVTFPGGRLGNVPRKQRPGLTLSNNVLFIPFGSFMESASTNVGVVVAVDVSNVTAPSIAAAWPTGVGRYPSAGIWQAGAAPSVDDNGGLHFMTGNGAFDPKAGYWGNCFIKLVFTPRSGSSPAGFSVPTWFSPYTDAIRAGDSPSSLTAMTDRPDDMGMHMAMGGMVMKDMPTNAINNTSNSHLVGDQDLGSGGAAFFPASFTGFGKDVDVGGGKDGIFHVLDAENMGNTALADFATPQGIQKNWSRLLSPPIAATYNGIGIDFTPDDITTLPTAFGGFTRHIHGQPAWDKSPDHGIMVFIHGENSSVKAYCLGSDYRLTWLADGQEIASAGMPPPGGMPGGMLSISRQHQGDNTGILWSLMPWFGDANRTITAGRLVGYASNWIQESGDQRNLIKVWDSAQFGIQYAHSKFTPLTTFNNRLWVPSYTGEILVFA
jgi:hypothetical protein